MRRYKSFDSPKLEFWDLLVGANMKLISDAEVPGSDVTPDEVRANRCNKNTLPDI